MKTIKILRELITWYYYLLAIGLIGLLFTPLLIFTDRQFEVTINNATIDIGNVGIYKKILVIVIVWTLYILYFKAIYHLRNSLADLSSGNYFTDLVIFSFQKAGYFLLITAALSLVVGFVLSLLFDLPIRLSFNTKFLLFLIMGLFFKFLSEVFKIARKNEQENNLTI